MNAHLLHSSYQFDLVDNSTVEYYHPNGADPIIISKRMHSLLFQEPNSIKWTPSNL